MDTALVGCCGPTYVGAVHSRSRKISGEGEVKSDDYGKTRQDVVICLTSAKKVTLFLETTVPFSSYYHEYRNPDPVHYVRLTYRLSFPHFLSLSLSIIPRPPTASITKCLPQNNLLSEYGPLFWLSYDHSPFPTACLGHRRRRLHWRVFPISHLWFLTIW
jgi:hypothetical protein